MIFEESCSTEDWSNDAENAFIFTNFLLVFLLILVIFSILEKIWRKSV